MDIQEALQIVLDLAKENVCDEDEMPEEYNRQMDAIAIVENLPSLVEIKE